jgi:hypothetical protein
MRGLSSFLSPNRDTIEIHACDLSISIAVYLHQIQNYVYFIIPKAIKTCTVYPNKDYDSLPCMRFFGMRCRDPTMTSHSSPHLLVETLASSADSLPSVSSDEGQAGFGTQHLKNDIRSVAGQAHEARYRAEASLSMHVSKGENGSVPQISISCIQPPAHRAVSSVIGGTEEGAQSAT